LSLSQLNFSKYLGSKLSRFKRRNIRMKLIGVDFILNLPRNIHCVISQRNGTMDLALQV